MWEICHHRIRLIMIQSHRERKRAPRYECSNWGVSLSGSMKRGICPGILSGGSLWVTYYTWPLTRKLFFVNLERFNRLDSMIKKITVCEALYICYIFIYQGQDISWNHSLQWYNTWRGLYQLTDVKDVWNDVKQMKNKVFCLMCLFVDLYKVQLFQLSRVLI